MVVQSAYTVYDSDVKCSVPSILYTYRLVVCSYTNFPCCRHTIIIRYNINMVK